MKQSVMKRLTVVAVTCGLIMAAVVNSWGAQTVTQTFNLHPGWNAVYLEVQPQPNTPAAIFAGLPVESVWTWYSPGSSMQFIKDPSEQLAGQSGWIAYFTAPAETFLTSLYALQVNTAYLVKIKGTAPVTWSVTGTPKPAQKTWTPNSFNLTGFSVDPAAPATIAAFFAGSPALKGQVVFRLNEAGRWEFLNNQAAVTLRSGEAYWVYCEGGADFVSPLKLVMQGNDLDFGAVLTRKTLEFRSLSGGVKNVTIRLQEAYPEVFTFKQFNESTQNYEWVNLEGLPALKVTPDQATVLSLAVRREKMSSPAVDTVLTITDNEGTRFMVPVHVEK